MRSTSERLLPIRGIMFDPARLIERHEFYFGLLEDLARWGINTILWHFVDDEGFMLRLSAYPQFASPYAFSKAKMRRFIRAAAQVGIDVIPEVESLGHARWLTSLPQYSHLADGGEVGFNAACPSHPDTLEIYGRIIREVAELFDSPYLHVGLDEVDLSGCPRCRRRARGRAHWWLYARHARALHRIVSDCNKRMIMWADHVENAPAILKHLPADVILMHWQYGRVYPERIEPSLQAGFDVILAPAICRGGNMICPTEGNLRNTDAMVALARRWRRRGVVGLINTFWTSIRGLRDTYIPAMAYTGRSLSAARPLEKRTFYRRYVRERFGLRHAAPADAMSMLHRTPVTRNELRALMFDSPADMHEAMNIAASGDLDARIETLGECIDTLSRAGKGVRTHRPEFYANIAAAKIALACLLNGRDLREALEAYARAEDLHDRGASVKTVAGHLSDAIGALQRIQRRTDGAYRLASSQWDRTRYPSDPKKYTRRPGSIPCSCDALLGRLARCRYFIGKFLPAFRKAASRFERDGTFPSLAV